MKRSGVFFADVVRSVRGVRIRFRCSLVVSPVVPVFCGNERPDKVDAHRVLAPQCRGPSDPHYVGQIPERLVIAEELAGTDDNPRILEETRQYIRDFDRLAQTTTTARELYDSMLELYPDRANPGALWEVGTRSQGVRGYQAYCIVTLDDNKALYLGPRGRSAHGRVSRSRMGRAGPR